MYFGGGRTLLIEEENWQSTLFILYIIDQQYFAKIRIQAAFEHIYIRRNSYYHQKNGQNMKYSSSEIKFIYSMACGGSQVSTELQ